MSRTVMSAWTQMPNVSNTSRTALTVPPHLAPVHGDEHVFRLRARCCEQGHCLAHGGTRGDNILDDDDAIALLGLVAHECPALAVILRLLAVEEEGLVDAVLPGEGGGGHCHERDPLIGRAEHGVERARALLVDKGGIERAERRYLRAHAVIGRVDEIRRAPARFGDKIAEAQRLRLKHEFDEFALILCFKSHRKTSSL